MGFEDAGWETVGDTGRYWRAEGWYTEDTEDTGDTGDTRGVSADPGDTLDTSGQGVCMYSSNSTKSTVILMVQ